MKVSLSAPSVVIPAGAALFEFVPEEQKYSCQRHQIAENSGIHFFFFARNEKIISQGNCDRSILCQFADIGDQPI